MSQPPITYARIRNEWLLSLASTLGMLVLVSGFVAVQSVKPAGNEPVVLTLVFNPFWAGVGHAAQVAAAVVGVAGGCLALLLRSHCLLAPLTGERLDPKAYERGLATLWQVPFFACFLACSGLILGAATWRPAGAGAPTTGTAAEMFAVWMVGALAMVLLWLAKPERQVVERGA